MREYGEIGIDKIRPDPNQPRKYFDKEKLIELGNSFKVCGMLDPIQIDDDNLIVRGARRWKAAKLVGFKTVPYFRDKGLTDIEKLEIQIIEVMNTEDWTWNEKLDAINKLKEQKKMTNEQVANFLGFSERHVYRLRSLDKLDPTVKLAIENKEISTREGMDIANKSKSEQRRFLKVKRGEVKPRIKAKKSDVLRRFGGVKFSDSLSTNSSESMKHFLIKAMLFKIITDKGKRAVCEMECPKGIADVAILRDGYIYEIQDKITPSIVKKKLEQFAEFTEVFIIDVKKVPDNLKDMEKELREKVL